MLFGFHSIQVIHISTECRTSQLFNSLCRCYLTSRLFVRNARPGPLIVTRCQSRGVLLLLLPLLQNLVLPLNDYFEKAQDLGQGSACVVCRPNHVKQGLAVRELLGNDRVGLAKGADAHRARVDLHGVQEAADVNWVALAPAAKGKFIDVQRHEVDLRLKVEAEADHARPALLVPGVGNFFEVDRHQAALFELTGNVAVQGAGEVVFQLAVQQALLSCVQRY